MSEDPRCKGCGGPLSVRSGQTMILGTTTVTFDNGKVVKERMSDDCWCGDCVDAWNAALHA